MVISAKLSFFVNAQIDLKDHATELSIYTGILQLSSMVYGILVTTDVPKISIDSVNYIKKLLIKFLLEKLNSNYYIMGDCNDMKTIN